MTRKLWTLSLLAMSLAVPSAFAQTAQTAPTAAATTTANAVDPASVQALRDMGTHLQTLKRFQVSTEVTGERVLADGQKLQHAASAVMDVERPKRLRAVMRSARSAREIFFDGKTVTLVTPAQKYYSTVELVDTLGGLVSRLHDRFGIELPLADLFVWGTPAAPFDSTRSAMNAGQKFIDQDLCDHYVFRQGKIDRQIWITTGAQPLPRKIVITHRADEARPQSVSLIRWNLKPTFKESNFRFLPPKGASAVEIVPLKNQ